MITLHLTGFTTEQEATLFQAKALGEKVRASLDFLIGIRAMHEPKLVTHLVQAEILNLHVVFYRPWWVFTKAVAYAEKGTIYLNKNAFKGPAELCSTLFHELTHLEPMNFKHGFYKSRERDESVPYRVGALVLKIARSLS